MVNPTWGGLTYVLDTTQPETLDLLERVASDLVSAGFRYLKIDFTYAPSLPGRYADSTLTPAQRVRAGLEAIRRGARDETFLLGCGCPLGPAIGVVDGMRIGPDVAPYWAPQPGHFVPPGYEREVPSTLNAWRNTLARSFMHRRLWLNDPDCIMLRTDQTNLKPDAVRAWALAVAASGGLAIVSDDLSLLDEDAKALFDEVLSVGRKVDETSRIGTPPRCEDLMETDIPGRLTSGDVRLVGDPTAPAAELLT
jgi:alpha-galactosidase